MATNLNAHHLHRRNHMTSLPLYGALTAIITPFNEGEVDVKALKDFVQWQVDEGINGLVPCGTTGESPTLFDHEDAIVIKTTLEIAKGKVPVIAGCGTNNTQHAIHLTQEAEKLGVDGALHVTPYYNKPTQEGLYQHFKAIHDNCGLPIIIYNIPGRSIVNVTVETMARLAALPRVIGVKDATNDLSRIAKTRKLCGPDFIQLSGNDDTALPFLAQGGHGVISVVSNIAPSLMVNMQDAWRKGDIATAQKINEQLAPLVEALFVETSPAPVKYAASLLGKCRNELRLPMVPCSKNTEKMVKDAMAGALLDVNINDGNKNAA
jgi:4-hydroxy-tetrahydrodipicolinate synthase